MSKKKTPQKKNILQAAAWRLRLGNNKIFTYRLQVNSVSNKAYPGLIKKLSGWSLTAEQTVADGKKKALVIFQKTFSSEEEFYQWAISAPFYLTEYSSTSDRPKSIKLGIAAPKKKGRKKGSKNKKKTGKKRCGICGKLGHNARTCPQK